MEKIQLTFLLLNVLREIQAFTEEYIPNHENFHSATHISFILNKS